jgi:hypothetical protein
LQEIQALGGWDELIPETIYDHGLPCEFKRDALNMLPTGSRLPYSSVFDPSELSAYYRKPRTAKKEVLHQRRIAHCMPKGLIRLEFKIMEFPNPKFVPPKS